MVFNTMFLLADVMRTLDTTRKTDEQVASLSQGQKGWQEEKRAEKRLEQAEPGNQNSSDDSNRKTRHYVPYCTF